MSTQTFTFTYGSTVLTVPTPQYPEEWGHDLNQWRSRAMGGRVVAVTRSTTQVRNPTLHWTGLSDADYAALRDFWYTTVGGSDNDVTWYDWNGSTWTVRYLGGLEEAKATEYDSWTVDLQLAVV